MTKSELISKLESIQTKGPITVMIANDEGQTTDIGRVYYDGGHQIIFLEEE